ncbi:MAG: methyltransferase domain-containing protein [Candidatus Aenigmatarchaeota archaeon]
MNNMRNSNILNSKYLEYCRRWVEENGFSDLVYDWYKVFDMYKTYEFSIKYLKKEDRIFFGGAYHDQSMLMLARLGYKKIVGMDLDKRIYDEKYFWKIKYYWGNILDTHLPPSFFKAYFALSVIEHLDYIENPLIREILNRLPIPFKGSIIFKKIDAFFKEAKRILKNGGYLVITTDYNDEEFHSFGWHIFNENSIKRIIEIAKNYGFELISDLETKIIDRPVIHENKQYTFIFLVFKLKKQENKRKIREVNIISPMRPNEGITIYSEHLKRRFEEIGIKVNLCKDYKECKKGVPTIFEYETGLLQDIRKLPRNVLIEIHSTVPDILSLFLRLIGARGYGKSSSQVSWPLSIRIKRYVMNFPFMLRNILAFRKYTVLVRANEFGPKNMKYYIMPHILYPDFGIRANPKNICLGSFGFAFPFKNFDKICELAIRLNVPLKLLLSINRSNDVAEKTCRLYANYIKERYGKYKNIKIKIGFFTDEEILRELSECSHIIFAQSETKQTSGSYRFPLQLGIPIIATESFQAKEAQVYRVKSLDEITTEKLKEEFKEPINMDDGFEYLLAILENL